MKVQGTAVARDFEHHHVDIMAMSTPLEEKKKKSNLPRSLNEMSFDLVLSISLNMTNI